MPSPPAASHPIEALAASHAAPEVDRLVLRWMAARHGAALPLFEDVALGSLGAIADRIGLACEEAPGRFRFLHAGPEFERQVGCDLTQAAEDALAPGYRAGIVDCLARAMARQVPSEGVARGVVDGAVATADVLALPLKNRWGGDLFMVYLRQRPMAQDLLDAMYRSTSDGLVALAAADDRAGRPDF